MVDNGIIALVTEPNECVSSLTYPRKSDDTICPCLDPHDLNKAIIHKHYKASILEEISHKLSSTTVFSKLMLRIDFGLYIWTYLHHTSPHLTPTRDAISTSTCHLD